VRKIRGLDRINYPADEEQIGSWRIRITGHG
jgi:hypothetical protein